MIYYEKDRKKMLRVDAPDYVLSVEEVKKTVKEDPDLEYFLNTNPLMRKMKDGDGVTPIELLEIEKKLSSFNSSLTIDNIQNLRKIDFVLFLRQLLDVKNLPDPEEMIKQEFDKYVIDRNEHYNAEQIKFLRLLREVFVRAKHIELKDFAKHPLTEERPLDLFEKKDLVKIVEKCNQLRFK